MTMTSAPAVTRGIGFGTMDEEVVSRPVEVTGRLPDWLAGTLVRVTPALLDVGGKPLRHWFDGLAMLNAFTLGGDGVTYGSRFLRTEAYARAREGELTPGFAHDPCRSIFKRVAALFRPGVTDNANVNLARLGEQYVAMTEVPLPIEFDPRTLETLGARRFEDRLGGQVTTAHPHYDPVRDEAINYVARFSARSSYVLYALPAGSSERRPIAKLPVREPAYMHSFGMSDRYLVLAEYPLVANPLELGFSGKPFIDNYRWRPERGTRFRVVDRHSGELRGTYEGEPFFSFHHVNAFERDGELVVDLVAFPDAAVVDAFGVERLRADAPMPAGTLRRCRIDLDGGDVRYEQLSDAVLELPRINYRAVNGRGYRYVYGAGALGPQGDWLDRVVKVDVTSGEVRGWDEDGCYPGEPVFVAGPAGRGEDDGVLLSVVLDARAERSFLVVLDAGTLEEIARAEAPQRIPFGFHGQFLGGVS